MEKPQAGNGTGLAKGLGWFSVGLGLAEVAAPRRVAKLIGVAEDRRSRIALRAAGAREIGHGVAILTRKGSAATLWARVAGDILDLAVLGWFLTSKRRRTERLLAAVGMVVGVTVIDILGGRKAVGKGLPTVTRAITVNRPLDEVRALLGDTEYLRYPAGAVTFRAAPGGRGTEICVTAASLGDAIMHDLRKVKQVLEIGEIVQSDASIHKGPHPAQPARQGGKS